MEGGYGGALYCGSCTAVAVTGAVFSSNGARWGGAVAYLSSGEKEEAVVMSGCTVNHNTAADGGGVFSASGYDEVHNSTFTNNFAGMQPG